MPNTLPPLVRYFRACYQADFRATRLLNFLSKKAALPLLFHDEAFLSGELMTLPLPTDWGEAMHAHLFLHAKEQQLYCHAFFLTGRTQILGKRRQVCAPLYLIPAELKYEAEVYQLVLDFAGTIINPAFAAVLQGNTEVADSQNSLYQTLNAQLPLPPFTFEALDQIETVLQAQLPQLLHPYYHSFPTKTSLEDLGHGVRQQKEGYALWPCAGLATLEKSVGSKGILNELETLTEQQHFSPILHTLFTKQELPQTLSADEEVAPLPVLLSERQEAILHSAASKTLTLVNGPPGTGKSFTIAAIAADRLSKGETVLIAAKNEQAVNVIADKLERDFELPDIAIRANRSDYRKHLRRRIKDWLNGLGMKYVYPAEMKRQKIELESRQREVATLQQQLEARIDRALSKQQLLSRSRLNLWQSWQRWWLKRDVFKQVLFWEEHQQLELRREQLQQAGKQYLQSLFFRRLNRAFRAHRQELQTVWEALRTQTGSEKERYFQQIDFKKLLQALPVWLVDTAHIHEVLPLERELFDLVIIDEATQCDIASALPLLQRAKRAVIVGDPKQLRHVSFLSRARQMALADQFGLPTNYRKEIGRALSYRDSSLLDLVSARIDDQQDIILLDEHFRSLPELIHFSNRHFYRSQLKIMTADPSAKQERCIHFNRINGQRDNKGYNERETNAIIRRIKSIIRQEEDLSPELCQSIGVLSPFRAQVDYVRKRFKETIPSEQLARHRILVGTAHDFQGEERDLMYLSFVVDANTPTGVLRYFQREDVFNVSITRARVAQHLFLSLDQQDIPADSLLAKYLQHTTPQENTENGHLPQLLEDPFLKEVRDYLESRGVENIFENYHIAGLEIDLVFVHNGRTHCIDLIGYPGPYEAAIPSNQWKMLGRLGLHPFSLPYSHWVFRPEESKHALRGLIE